MGDGLDGGVGVGLEGAARGGERPGIAEVVSFFQVPLKYVTHTDKT